MIDTNGLLRGDQQRGDASERAREEEALIIHLSDNNLVRAIQHPVRERTHTIPIRERNIITSSFFASHFAMGNESYRRIHTFVYAHIFRTDKNTVQAHVTHLFVWSLRAEFGAISISPAFTSGLSMCSSS